MITRDEVLKLAALARLNLDESEIAQFQQDLGKILEYVDQLSQLPDVQSSQESIDKETSNVLREDMIKPSLSVEQALANAPDKTGDLFKVPKVVGN